MPPESIQVELAYFDLLAYRNYNPRQMAKPESSMLLASMMPQSVGTEAKSEPTLHPTRSAHQCTLACVAQACFVDAPASMQLWKSAEHTLTRCITWLPRSVTARRKEARRHLRSKSGTVSRKETCATPGDPQRPCGKLTNCKGGQGLR